MFCRGLTPYFWYISVFPLHYHAPSDYCNVVLSSAVAGRCYTGLMTDDGGYIRSRIIWMVHWRESPCHFLGTWRNIVQMRSGREALRWMDRSRGAIARWGARIPKVACGEHGTHDSLEETTWLTLYSARDRRFMRKRDIQRKERKKKK